MVSKVDSEKGSAAGQLSVTTTDLGSGAALSPTSTFDGAEKGSKDITINYRPASVVSTPSSAHHANPFNHDLEANQSSENLHRNSTTLTGTTGRKLNDAHNPNCTVWPGQEHWKKKARAARVKNRTCKPIAHLSKRTRVIIHVLTVALVVGIAVAVGLGISKSLGVGIWKPSNS
jgi:hypothetical protein